MLLTTDAGNKENSLTGRHCRLHSKVFCVKGNQIWFDSNVEVAYEVGPIVLTKLFSSSSVITVTMILLCVSHLTFNEKQHIDLVCVGFTQPVEASGKDFPGRVKPLDDFSF
jgi:hypothetical protein